MSARAEPVVVAGDRTHYLSQPDADFPQFQRHHALVGRTQVSVYRFHAADMGADRGTFCLESGPFMAYVECTAEQMRLIATALLQCADDLDSREQLPNTKTFTPTPDSLPAMASIERTPWALPGVTA